jgi:hypothetical protein
MHLRPQREGGTAAAVPGTGIRVTSRSETGPGSAFRWLPRSVVVPGPISTIAAPSALLGLTLRDRCRFSPQGAVPVQDPAVRGTVCLCLRRDRVIGNGVELPRLIPSERACARGGDACTRGSSSEQMARRAPGPLLIFVPQSSQGLDLPARPRCSLQAISKAERVTGNAARGGESAHAVCMQERA